MGAVTSLWQADGSQGRAARPRPPDRADIGRAAWRYVHAMAADYPDRPTQERQEEALGWLRSFVRLYPCELCSREFIEVCSDLPPRLGSREDYAVWWCEAHNRVRDDLSQSLCRCDASELLAVGRAGGVVPVAGPSPTGRGGGGGTGAG
eukprot:CAMPEP_0204569324 /NCGR_PEP_ID=MMETSP0661-20131031/37684_1 /ASSEMBLY_ACC=CAM_ASM_000606 /TAXON_ID=109239 /ORGANISM="Alexandrium margalefi, Strain AMGDE01CS-322" /LENGTH=148 /DNA_ID=CAMNT_0051577419 /DNA_START=119 /DNA_END=562 /DNA_ORIENTATION=+